jgi:hypothetical protein
MNTSIVRNPWHTIWQTVTGNGLLVGLLVAIAASLLAALWLPQMPDADPVAYARWMSDAHATFGAATGTIQTLGLLSITQSLGFRILLALLAAILLLRLIELGDRLLVRTEQRQRACWFSAMAQAGTLLLLLGHLLAHLWGWQVEGLLVQAGERITIPGTESWVSVTQSPYQVSHSRGIVPFVEGYEPGVQVTASDGRDRSLGLQRTPKAEPLVQLTLALDEEQFFAIPEAGLVVQLTSHPSELDDATDAVNVRVYRSPPGRLETEQVLEGSGEVGVDGVTLHITSAPFARIAAASNPGLWPTALGLTLTVIGIVGSVARRRPSLQAADEEQ